MTYLVIYSVIFDRNFLTTVENTILEVQFFIEND